MIFSADKFKPDLEPATEFTLPPAATVPDNSFTPLCHGGGKTFAIFRDDKLRPIVAEIPDGSEGTSVRLDPSGAGSPRTEYVSQSRDAQQCYSLGLDKKGYIHVTGDMHGYPGANDRFMPPRYAKKIIVYWISNKPYSIQDGFTFVGGDSEKAIPGTKWSYGSFYADNEGELYYTAHVAAITKHVPMEVGVGLWHYEVEKGSWTALGAEPPHIYPGAEYHPVLLWDFPGTPIWAKESHGTLCFDKKNRMHFAAPASTDASAVGLNALLYARSEDGGKTWKKANGTPIAGLPFRASGPNQADLAGASKQTGLLLRTYDANDCTGTPLKARIEKGVDLSGETGANSARWTGEIVARESGQITLELATNGDTSMNLIKYQKGIMDYSTKMKAGDAYILTLDKGQAIGIDVEWRKTHASGAISLNWTTPGHNKEKIPQEFLLPGHTRFDLFASVFVDRNGTPAIACSPSNSMDSGWRFWDVKSKAWTDDLLWPGVSRTFNKAYTGPDGVMWFESNSGIMHYSKAAYQYVVDPTMLTRGVAFDGPPKRYGIDYTSIWGADDSTFRKTGVYRAIAFDEKAQLWKVVSFTLPQTK